MIRNALLETLFLLANLTHQVFFPTPTPSAPPINHPPALESNRLALNSGTVITVQNAHEIIPAAEARFSPWELTTALTWSPDGEFLAIGAGEKILLLQLDEWRVFASIEVDSLTQSLAFSHDGNWLAAGGRDGLVRCWFQPLSGDPAKSITRPSITFQAHKKGVNDLAFSPDGIVLASGGNDAVARFWDLSTSQALGLMIGGTFAVPAIAFAPDGDVLAVANGNIIRLRQVGSERILGSFQADQPLFSLAYSPDGRWLAAGDMGNQVLLWKPEQAFRTGQPVYPEPVRLVAHAGDSGTFRALIWDIGFSPNNQLLASSGGDRTIRLWDVSNAVLVATLSGHNAAVTSVKFNAQANALASSGLDGRVVVWKIPPGK